MKIIFIATGEFGAKVLERLAQSEYKPVFLICSPDKPVGRKQILTPCPAKTKAQALGITIKEKPADINELTEFLTNEEYDFLIVSDTDFILPNEILETPHYAAFNVHPSLLPKYRGSSPIQAAILNGNIETGITIIKMDEKIDHGAIVANRQWQIANGISFETLRDQLADLGGQLLIEILPQWPEGTVKIEEQNHEIATYTKRLKKEDGLIDWKKPAEIIERQIRAYHTWPGSYTFFEWKGQKKRLNIHKARIIPNTKYKILNTNSTPGTIIKDSKKELIVACGKDALILDEVQPEGKKPMTGETFLNGYSITNFTT